MPFPTQTPRPFTRAGIEWLAAGQTGVYGIFRDGFWVYVGKAQCLRARLLEHFAGGNPEIVKHLPTHYVTMVTPDGDMVEKQLIIELQPAANQKVG